MRGRITSTLDYADLADADLVIEAITEDLGAEARDLARDRRHRQGRGVFATNTSSLPVIDQAAVDHAARPFLGLHFFNPAQVMELLEVDPARHHADEAFAAGMEFGQKLGKLTVDDPRQRPASSSTGCSCHTCSTGSAATRRASARSARSTPQ